MTEGRERAVRSLPRLTHVPARNRQETKSKLNQNIRGAARMDSAEVPQLQLCSRQTDSKRLSQT